MERLLKAAWSTHPTVAGRQADQAAAAADTRAAQWQRYPSLSLEAGAADSGGASHSVRLDQPVWDAGRIEAGVTLAQMREAAAAAAVAQARRDLSLRVVLAASAAVRQRERQVVAQANLAAHEKLFSMIQRRVQQEVSPKADELLARSRRQLSEAELSLARQAGRSALLQLGQLTNEAVEGVAPIALHAQSAWSEQGLPALLSQATTTSPMLARMALELTAVDAEIRAKQAAYKPQVVLRLENSHNRAAGVGRDTRLMLLLQAQPGAGLSALSAVEAAVAKRESVASARQAAQRDVEEGVVLAWNDWNAARERQELTANVRASTADVAASYERQYVAGRKTWLDVLNALREAGQAELAWVDAQHDTQLAALKLLVATGGLDER